MTQTRAQIVRRIETDPGIHFNGLVRGLDLAPGQAQHHLRRLLVDGSVVEERLYGRTQYYPPGFDDWTRGAIALVRRETGRDVVVHLLKHRQARPEAVAGALGIARSTLEWHLNRLEECGIVAKQRDEDGLVRLSLERPEETARVLTLVEPTIAERMTDRFARLLDSLLEE